MPRKVKKYWKDAGWVALDDGRDGFEACRILPDIEYDELQADSDYTPRTAIYCTSQEIADKLVKFLNSKSKE